MVDPAITPGRRNTRFFLIMAFFLGSGALLVFLGNHYRGKFGQAAGIVLEESGGKPIASAKVKIVGAFDSKYGSSNTSIKIERSALTDSAGTFMLRETVAGQYLLSVECAGYKRFEKPIEIGLQEHKDLGVIELVPLR